MKGFKCLEAERGQRARVEYESVRAERSERECESVSGGRAEGSMGARAEMKASGMEVRYSTFLTPGQ